MKALCLLVGLIGGVACVDLERASVRDEDHTGTSISGICLPEDFPCTNPGGGGGGGGGGGPPADPPGTGPALSSAKIQFQTNDDDKDGDTFLSVTIKDSTGLVVATLSGTFGL